MSVARHLRYSPRNFLVVNWAQEGGRAFSECGLPSPIPCRVSGDCGDACGHTLPIQEAIDTYDWERWLPEVIVGVEDPDEEIAANYVRQAAIEFCKGARVLQREIVIELQPNVSTYPVFPYEGEQIIGVIGTKTPDGVPCFCAPWGGIWMGGQWRLDVARNEFSIANAPSRGLFKMLVWSAPTEDSCAHDVFLYDRFRADITMGARFAYTTAVHFRDRALLASLPPADHFQRAIVSAKTKALQLPSSWPSMSGGTFGVGRLPTREDYFFHRS